MTSIAISLTAYTSHLNDLAISTAGKEPTRASCVQNGGKYAEIVYLLIYELPVYPQRQGVYMRD